MNKIKQTSSNKVNGKLVKYRKGDCLSLDCGNGKHLGIIISNKFNKYYDLTLTNFYECKKPVIANFIEGNFFGTRFGSWEDLTYAVDVQMIECKYIDNSPQLEIIGSLKLTNSFTKAGYAYLGSTTELVNYYLEEIPIRNEKSINAEKFPDLAFVSKHLIEVKKIIE